MPPVPLQTLARDTDGAQRAEAILDAARAAFVEKGFEGASMQDLARSAGMSAGNFYRYFPSKSALVDSLIARDLREVEATFQAIIAAPDPMAAMKAALRERLTEKTCHGDDALWAEIFATGARRPEVAVALRRMEEGIVRPLAEVLAVVHRVPRAEAFARFATHARLIFLIMHGAMTNNHAGQPQDPRLAELILRTIDRLVSDALADTAGRGDPA